MLCPKYELDIHVFVSLNCLFSLAGSLRKWLVYYAPYYADSPFKRVYFLNWDSSKQGNQHFYQISYYCVEKPQTT